VSDVYALVRDLKENRFPRNRNFDAHTHPMSEEARRLLRFLRGIERDVLGAKEVRVVRADGGSYTLTLAFPAVRLTRVVSLTPGEYGLLVEDEALAARLQPTG
jgi:hypothetical protein